MVEKEMSSIIKSGKNIINIFEKKRVKPADLVCIRLFQFI